MPEAGFYVGPAVIELDRARDLAGNFRPGLHVVRWRADALDALLEDIAANGTALTLGIHSRIDGTIERIIARLVNGNVYVNRGMIGAVVGTRLRRHPSLRHRPEVRRAEVPAPLRDQVGRHGQHRCHRRQCRPVGGGRMNGGT